MERLTDRWRNADTDDFIAYHLKQNTGFEWNRALKKLGQYEDAEEEGRLIILPCKPGDTVFTVKNYWSTCHMGEIKDDYSCAGCEEEFCDSKRMYRIEESIFNREDIMLNCFLWGTFGKTVFTTREAAEQRKAELERDEHDLNHKGGQ